MDTSKIKVMKFGGSCLEDSYGFSKVVEIISIDQQSAVVVSAVKGVTSAIINSLEDPGTINGDGSIFRFLSERHMGIATQLIHGKFLEDFGRSLGNLLEKMAEYKLPPSQTTEDKERYSAFVQSFGEKISVTLIAAILRERGIGAREFYADDLGIVTEGGYLSGTVSIDQTRFNIRDILLECIANGEVPVITGYIGRNSKGETTLLGRDGSDYTAAVVASCIGSTNLILWKDVDGIMTGDPKKDKSCLVLKNVSYEQAEELSRGGAKVLHPMAVLEARKHMVSIRVKSLFDPLSEGSLISY